jgi:hypothetical protein
MLTFSIGVFNAEKSAVLRRRRMDTDDEDTPIYIKLSEIERHLKVIATWSAIAALGVVLIAGKLLWP